MIDDVPTLSAADDLELFEMANLTTERTSVAGNICISTAQPSHAPHVKWYPSRPKDKSPCLCVPFEAIPQAINHRLPPHVFNEAADEVKVWVLLNLPELVAFWTAGATWLDDEVDAFKKGLKRLP